MRNILSPLKNILLLLLSAVSDVRNFDTKNKRRSVMKKIFLQLSLAAIFVLAALGSAVAQSGFVAQTWVYDPGHTGVSVSQWQPGSGLPDAGNSNHGLYLTKFASTTTLAAAGASIKGVNGITLSTLGFDVRNDGWCGAG